LHGQRRDMTDAEWEVLRSALPQKHQGPCRIHDRRVMDGIFFVLHTGIPWRGLPERYGPYTTCFNRYNRWSRNGTWAMIMEVLQGFVGDDDDDSGGGPAGSVHRRMMDSPSVRVHTHAAGASRDGLRATQAVPVPVTPAQAEDLPVGLAPGETVPGDTASDAARRHNGRAGARANIPSHSCRTVPGPLEGPLEKACARGVRFFGEVRELRRAASCCDRTVRNFLFTVRLAGCRFLPRRLAWPCGGTA